MSMTFKFEGDVEEFAKFTDPKILDGTFEREIRKATIRNALFLIKEIKTRIRERQYLENAPLTIALAGGKKDIPLLKTKNMVNAIVHKLETSFKAEVGFLSNRNAAGGATKDRIKLKKVVELMHEGYVITVTPKMRQAIAAALTQRSKSGKLTKKSQTLLRTLSLAGTFNSDRDRTYRVPARPFMTAVFESKLVNRQIQREWREALERVWGSMGAKGGDEKDRGGDSGGIPDKED